MKPAIRHAAAALVAAALAASAAAQGSRAKVDPKQPLTLKSQGSLFVGGEKKTVAAPAAPGASASPAGQITVNQMYVQYQVPLKGEQHVPVVMVHGCCLSSKTWETTPDGRIGWSEYFVRRDRSVYLADQVSRARSGFDPTSFAAVRAGEQPPATMPGILSATHQVAWTVFRFGPKFGEAFADQQFPMQAMDELYKQMIPDLNATLPASANPTWTQMAALAKQLNGAVLMGHSESGFFPERAALIDPSGVRGIVSIEMPCETSLGTAEIATLAKIPTLIMFGDHLGDIPPAAGIPVNWADAFATCNTFVEQLHKAGGDATMMHLPALGIRGNSHMLMQDKNSDQLAELVLDWLDKHVDAKKGKART
jgi:pimeloyl-ACP methyl ester carboxylesterase